MNRYDLIVLGGGPGGYVAAIRAAKQGKSTLLIEQEHVGGTCLNRGCIPTKALLHASEMYSMIKGASRYGVTAENVRFDFEALAKKKDAVVGKLRGGVSALLRGAGVTVVAARGELVSRNEISAGGAVYSAENIIIATGSAPSVPPIKGAESEGVLTSDGVLSLRRAPESVAIIGGGVIGMEFAAFFSGLGIPVTVLEALPETLAGFDRDVVSPVLQSLEGAGVKIHCAAKVLSIEKSENLSVTYEAGGKVCRLDSEIVVVAAGRKPSTPGIGLENAGVLTDAKGYVRVDDSLMTNIPGIYAIGDVTGKLQLAHVASAQGLVAADNICGKKRVMRYHAVPGCVYTAPEIAVIGMTADQAAERGIKARTGSFPVAANGRSMILEESGGCAKLVVDEATGEILGAHLCAPHATDMIAEIAVAMNAEATIEELADTIHPHPTVSEIVMEAAHDIEGLCCHKL